MIHKLHNRFSLLALPIALVIGLFQSLVWPETFESSPVFYYGSYAMIVLFTVVEIQMTAYVKAVNPSIVIFVVLGLSFFKMLALLAWLLIAISKGMIATVGELIPFLILYFAFLVLGVIGCIRIVNE